MSSDRAREANEMGASMCISLHLASGLPEASGPTCSYFGSASTHSPAGMLLAQLILEELEAELGVRGRLQRLTGAMLRETRMPAVQVEPVFITNAVEAALLVDPEFGGRIGRAVAAGVRRFFAGLTAATAQQGEREAQQRADHHRVDGAFAFRRGRGLGGLGHRGGYATRRCASA